MNPAVGVGKLLPPSALEKAQLASSPSHGGGGGEYTGGSWFPRSKQLLEKSMQEPCPKHNVHGRQGTGSCEQKLMFMCPPRRTNFISTGSKSFPLSLASASVTRPSILSLV